MKKSYLNLKKKMQSLDMNSYMSDDGDELPNDIYTSPLIDMVDLSLVFDDCCNHTQSKQLNLNHDPNFTSWIDNKNDEVTCIVRKDEEDVKYIRPACFESEDDELIDTIDDYAFKKENYDFIPTTSDLNSIVESIFSSGNNFYSFKRDENKQLRIMPEYLFKCKLDSDSGKLEAKECSAGPFDKSFSFNKSAWCEDTRQEYDLFNFCDDIDFLNTTQSNNNLYLSQFLDNNFSDKNPKRFRNNKIFQDLDEYSGQVFCCKENQEIFRDIDITIT